MGCSLVEPVARTDFAPGPALPPRLASLTWTWGLSYGKGGFIRSFVIFLSFRDTKLITLFLILVGSLFSVRLAEAGRGLRQGDEHKAGRMWAQALRGQGERCGELVEWAAALAASAFWAVLCGLVAHAVISLDLIKDYSTSFVPSLRKITPE